MKRRLYLPCQRQTDDGRWGQAVAPTPDCNYHDKSRSEHSLAGLAEGGPNTYVMWVISSYCQHHPIRRKSLDLCLCVCICVFLGDRLPLWPSSVLWPTWLRFLLVCQLCLQTHVPHKRVDKGRRHGREPFTGSDGHFSSHVPCECCLSYGGCYTSVNLPVQHEDLKEIFIM